MSRRRQADFFVARFSGCFSSFGCLAVWLLRWIAFSMAAISRTLVDGTWLKMLRYQ